MPSKISFAADTTTQRRTSIYRPAEKKARMSITQTYFLAHTARSKLSREAARADHDLRLLVGHANMLDNLMIDLANAEQEQERWFNQSLNKHRQEEKIEHEPAILEEDESEDEESTIEPIHMDEEADEDLSLTRTVSRSQSPPNSPPELTMEADSDSEDELLMPPSPPTLSLSDPAASFAKHDFALAHQPTLIAAY